MANCLHVHQKQIMMFLHTIVHNVRFHVVGSQFHKLIEIVHRYFRIVLKKGFLKLYIFLIRLPSEHTPSEIRERGRFYPYSKVNIGTY